MGSMVPFARNAQPPGYFATDRPDLLQWAPGLMERHARFATSDLARAQAHLSGLHESIQLNVDHPQDFVNYHEVLLTMGHLQLTMGCINALRGYELRFHTGDEYIITVPLRGSGWASTGELFVEYGENDIMIVAPSCAVVKHWDGPGEVLSLHVPTDRFDQAIARLGISGLPIAPISTIGARRLRSFLRVIDTVCRDLNDGTSPFLANPLAQQLEDILLTLLLEHIIDGQPSDAVNLVNLSPAVPYYVRRAEEFIAANAHREISIEDIAGAAGVSLRTVQYGFRKYRKITPMLYMKHLRYARARAILQTPLGARRKISEIAAEIGCNNISQFSRDYRAMFGETPSDTIAAPRRMVA